MVVRFGARALLLGDEPAINPIAVERCALPGRGLADGRLLLHIVKIHDVFVRGLLGGGGHGGLPGQNLKLYDKPFYRSPVADFFCSRSKTGVRRSIGTGNTIVELLSPAILASVWR